MGVKLLRPAATPLVAAKLVRADFVPPPTLAGDFATAECWRVLESCACLLLAAKTGPERPIPAKTASTTARRKLLVRRDMMIFHSCSRKLGVRGCRALRSSTQA